MAAEQTVDMVVYILCSGVYHRHRHDATLGQQLFASRLVIPGCVWSCTFTWITTWQQLIVTGSLELPPYVCLSLETLNPVNWFSLIQAGSTLLPGPAKVLLVLLMIYQNTEFHALVDVCINLSCWSISFTTDWSYFNSCEHVCLMFRYPLYWRSF